MSYGSLVCVTQVPLSKAIGEGFYGEAHGDSKDGVGGDGDEDEAGGNGDVKDLWIRGEEHAEFQDECHEDGPTPMASSGIADDGDVHNTEGCAVAEVVEPADDLGGEGVVGLFNGLAEDHCAKSREDFEKLHGRNDGGDAPFFGEDEREAEDVISHGGEEAADKADHDGAPELAMAAPAVENGNDNEREHGREENERREDAHGAEAVKVEQETSDG